MSQSTVSASCGAEVAGGGVGCCWPTLISAGSMNKGCCGVGLLFMNAGAGAGAGAYADAGAYAGASAGAEDIGAPTRAIPRSSSSG